MYRRKRVFRAQDYLNSFQEYMNQYCREFYNATVNIDTVPDILDQAANLSNQRYRYPVYFLWASNKSICQYYLDKGLEEYIIYGSKLLTNMLTHPLFNDYNMHRFIRILNQEYGVYEQAKKFKERGMVYGSIANDEFYSFIWQFIVYFKRKHQLFDPSSEAFY